MKSIESVEIRTGDEKTGFGKTENTNLGFAQNQYIVFARNEFGLDSAGYACAPRFARR